MPLVDITLGQGRSPEQLDQLLHDVTLAVSGAVDAPVESIRVILREVPLTHWAVGGRSIAARRADPAP